MSTNCCNKTNINRTQAQSVAAIGRLMTSFRSAPARQRWICMCRHKFTLLSSNDSAQSFSRVVFSWASCRSRRRNVKRRIIALDNWPDSHRYKSLHERDDFNLHRLPSKTTLAYEEWFSFSELSHKRKSMVLGIVCHRLTSHADLHVC